MARNTCFATKRRSRCNLRVRYSLHAFDTTAQPARPEWRAGENVEIRIGGSGVLSTGELSIPALTEQDSGDVLTRFLVEYLYQNTPPGTLEEVYRLADVSHLAEQLGPDAGWSPYVRRRSLLEAAAVVLGAGADALTAIGQCVFNSIRRPELMEAFQALGSPEAV
jgi:hypothetical protein